MMDEDVWKSTHQRGGALFKMCGVLALVGVLFPDYMVWIILIPILFTTFYLFYYSYAEYQKNERPSIDA